MPLAWSSRHGLQVASGLQAPRGLQLLSVAAGCEVAVPRRHEYEEQAQGLLGLRPTLPPVSISV